MLQLAFFIFIFKYASEIQDGITQNSMHKRSTGYLNVEGNGVPCSDILHVV